MPVTRLMKVDFPAPFGPMSEVMLLLCKPKETSFKAKIPPKCLLTPVTSRIELVSGEAFTGPPCKVSNLFKPSRQARWHEYQDDYEDHAEKRGMSFCGNHGQELAKIYLYPLSEPKNDETPEEWTPKRFPLPMIIIVVSSTRSAKSNMRAFK